MTSQNIALLLPARSTPCVERLKTNRIKTFKVFTCLRASTDIVSQLCDKSGLTDLVSTVANFTSLLGNLQRALLWSAGWVQVATESEDSSSSPATRRLSMPKSTYSSMSDVHVFQSAQAFDDSTQCELKTCKSNVIAYTTSTCEPSYVATKVQCAVSLGANVAFKQKNGPM